MPEPTASELMRALRRAVSYAKLYGGGHRLSVEAAQESARAAVQMADGDATVMLAFAEETLFVNGEAQGHTSLQFNGFLRALEAAGVESLVFGARVDPEDISGFVSLVAGESETYRGGDSLRVNGVTLGNEGGAQSPTATLRRSYSASLDALRGLGLAVNRGEPLSLEGTADAVRGMLQQVVANPTASLLLSTVKNHHEYTFYHSVNTGILSLGLAHLIGLSEDDKLLLGMGAMLHDIGKVGVSTSILQHPGRLDAEQWEQIRRHPQIGAEAILSASGPGQEITAVVAFEHHARFDGSGYPRLVYHDGTGHHHTDSRPHPLHFFSRLVAVADTYDALTTRRSYRRAEPPSRALQILIGEAGTSYDPDFVLAFAHLIGVHPPGSFLRLSSGLVVMVTDAPAEPGAPPAAVVVRDPSGATVDAPEPASYRLEDVVGHVAPGLLGMTPTDVLERIA